MKGEKQWFNIRTRQKSRTELWISWMPWILRKTVKRRTAMTEFAGYGIDLCDHMKLDSLPGLLAFAQKYTPDIYGEICEWLRDRGKKETEPENVKEWFGNYEHDGYTGIAAYLTAVINEQEGTQFRCFDVDCDCIYFPQEYPWKMNEKMRKMTEEEFCGLIRKYISQVKEMVYVFADMEMYDG